MASGRSTAKTDHIYYKEYSHQYASTDYHAYDNDPSYYNGANYRLNAGTGCNYKLPSGYFAVITNFTTGNSAAGINLIRPGTSFNFERVGGTCSGTYRFGIMFVPKTMEDE